LDDCSVYGYNFSFDGDVIDKWFFLDYSI
jgi:hypothetical protein